LTGNGYDFTLRDVVATDRPTPFGIDPYFNPLNFTLPQTNGRVGYFLTDTFSVSFGVDHMKYVMVQDQTVNIEGTIANGMGFDGTYIAGDTQTLSADFLTFEHTDGLNMISVEFEQYFPLWVASQGRSAISAYWGMGTGFMYPRTNATLFGQTRHDDFNLAGYAVSAKLGTEWLFKNDFFSRLIYKVGDINMTDVRTTYSTTDKLTQRIQFQELTLAFGMYF
ncbi:MAG: hypothetical protein OEX12_10525, partial [Gammaproteobacteria bacterium]|nr:hypothetical protein [Gammaproteobacteria bacterium]